jgi:hypothetical protein
MKTLARFFLYGFVAALFLGDSVAEKASVIVSVMVLCIGCAFVDWLFARDGSWQSDVDYEDPVAWHPNVIPMRRR